MQLFAFKSLMAKLLRTKYGFSIIELVVTISITAILLGLSYTQYASFSQRQKLINSGQTLKNLLRDVESRSFNGEVDCSVCNCTEPGELLQVRWFVDLANRQFYGVCGTGDPFTVTGLGLPGDIFLLTNSSDSLIEFLNSPSSVDEDTNICMSLDGLDNRYYRLEIYSSGEISDSGGVIP